eukprot:Rmarinus@m.28951
MDIPDPPEGYTLSLLGSFDSSGSIPSLALAPPTTIDGIPPLSNPVLTTNEASGLLSGPDAAVQSEVCRLLDIPLHVDASASFETSVLEALTQKNNSPEIRETDQHSSRELHRVSSEVITSPRRRPPQLSRSLTLPCQGWDSSGPVENTTPTSDRKRNRNRTPRGARAKTTVELPESDKPLGEEFEDQLEAYITFEEQAALNHSGGRMMSGAPVGGRLLVLNQLADRVLDSPQANLVSPDAIEKVLPLLERRCDGATAMLLFASEEDEQANGTTADDHVEDSKRGATATSDAEVVLSALEACLLVVALLSMPNAKREFCSEELIDSITGLSRSQMKNSIFPFFSGRKGNATKRTEHLKIANLATGKLSAILTGFCRILELYGVTDAQASQLSTVLIDSYAYEKLVQLQQVAGDVLSDLFERHPECRLVILDELAGILPDLHTGSRPALVSRRASSGDDVNMYVITDVLTRLIQCSVPSEENPISLQLAATYCQAFVKSCAVRMSSKSGADSRSEMWAIVDILIRDLVKMVELPEYPAAITLLAAFSDELRDIFCDQNNKNDAQLRCWCTSSVSVIYRLCRQLSEAKDTPWKAAETMSPVGKANGLERAVVLLRLAEKSELPLQAHARAYWVHELARSDPELVSSRDDLWKPLLQQHEEILAVGESATPCEHVRQAVRRLLLHHPDFIRLTRSRDVLLHALVDSRPLVRVRALKALSFIAEVSPEFLGESEVFEAISQRLEDTATSVREAALEVIGTYINTSHGLMGKYYATLSDKLTDIGLSVRKRVIRILRDFFAQYPRAELFADACKRLVSRLNDSEEVIRDLANKALLELWFGIGGQPAAPNGLTKKTSDHPPDALTYAERARVIASVVGIAKQTRWLRELVAAGLDTGTKAEQAATNEKLQSMAQALVDLFLRCEDVVGSDGAAGAGEGDAPRTARDGTATATNGSVPEGKDADRPDATFQLGLLLTMSELARAKVELMLPHVRTLVPYLTPSSAGRPKDARETSMINVIADMLEFVLPKMERRDKRLEAKVVDAADSLIGLTTSYELLQTCVRCMSTLASNSGRVSVLENRCRKLHHSLSVVVDQPLASSRPLYLHFVRALWILPLFVRYFDLDTEIPGLLQGQRVAVTAAIHETFLKCVSLCQRGKLSAAATTAGESQERLLVRILAGLVHIHVRVPRFILEKPAQELYLQSFALDAGPLIHEQVLRNISTFLTAEEERIASTQQVHRIKKGSLVKTAVDNARKMEDSGESGASGILVCHFLPQLQALSQSASCRTRAALVQVLQLVVRNGLANPRKVARTLIALLGDVSNRGTVCVLLRTLVDKYPSHVFAISSAAVRDTYELQKRISSDDATVRAVVRDVRGAATSAPAASPSGVDAVHGPLLRCFASVRKGRVTDFLKDFLKPFRELCAEDLSGFTRGSEMDYLRYLVEDVSALPFTQSVEPFTVAEEITKLVDLRAVDVLSEFEKILQLPEGEVVGEGVQANVAAGDASSSRVRAVRAQAIALRSLLSLRTYLRDKYSLRRFSDVAAARRGDFRRTSDNFLDVSALFEGADRQDLVMEELKQQYDAFDAAVHRLDEADTPLPSGEMLLAAGPVYVSDGLSTPATPGTPGTALLGSASTSGVRGKKQTRRRPPSTTKKPKKKRRKKLTSLSDDENNDNDDSDSDYLG